MNSLPTKAELNESRIEDIENEFDIVLPEYGPNFLRDLSILLAGTDTMLYRYIGNTQKNIAPDEAQPQELGGTLDRYGLIKLGRKRFPATQARYSATVTGTTGAVVPAGQIFKSNDTSLAPGYLYICDTAYTLPGSSGTITIRALTSGTEARLAATNTLTATSPMTLVDSLITVSAETLAPRAAETVEEYRAKILQAYRIEPQGGATGDYRLWGYDAQGVREIYVYNSDGNLNEVDVYVEATEADSTDGKGTPTSTILTDVEDAIELNPDTTLTMAQRVRRPVTVFQVNVAAIVLKEIDIDIADFADLTSAKQTAIYAAMKEALYTVRPYIGGLDAQADKNDIFDSNRISRVVLNAVPGSSFGAVTLKVAGVTVDTYTFDNGEVPWLDTISYV